MAIYKVRIKNDSNKITYKTNSTILATVEYQPEIDKYFVSTPTELIEANTLIDADYVARVRISDYFTSLGLVPNFITE